ncbi:Autophagy-like protein [Ceratobasidium theobromae]|uniref:Autophagy-like protein n=1 Tax=Ceratobasidium theobromae TaxID=1582974 RepID=A0A5N5QRP6_9AGAM|nr:Autophagy-like protein [Ceratobasidium theobromae]
MLPIDAGTAIGMDGRAALAWYEARRAVAERDALIADMRGKEGVERPNSPGATGWSVVDLRELETTGTAFDNANSADDWEECTPTAD